MSIETIQTEHYKFNVCFTPAYVRDILYRHYIEIGDPKHPCLSLNIFTKEASDIIEKGIDKTAKLSNIDALYECVIEQTNEDFSKYSFGKELLQWVIIYIKSKHNQVTILQLTDESYIPCNRRPLDTVDLLSYSIALYSKTWYELNFNAYIEDKEVYAMYKKSIGIYSLPSTKSANSWDTFFLKNITSVYAKNIILENEELYKTLYESSDTFPVFFKKISNVIGKENKCKFFKTWLQEFINSYVTITRKWTIKIKSEGGRYNKSRKSRK